MKAAVVVFPGINRERDMAIALELATGHKPRMIWHKETDLGDADLVVLPGGFSYGDYLRCGAMASLSPVMGAVRRHAERDRNHVEERRLGQGHPLRSEIGGDREFQPIVPRHGRRQFGAAAIGVGLAAKQHRPVGIRQR